MKTILVTMSAFFSMVVGMIFLVFIWGIIISYPMMLLWNYYLVPSFTVLKTVGWMQMYGIIILFNVLFKSSVNKK